MRYGVTALTRRVPCGRPCGGGDSISALPVTQPGASSFSTYPDAQCAHGQPLPELSIACRSLGLRKEPIGYVPPKARTERPGNSSSTEP